MYFITDYTTLKSYPQISSLKHGTGFSQVSPEKNTARKDRLTFGTINMVYFLPLRKIVHQVLCASFGYNFQFSFIVFLKGIEVFSFKKIAFTKMNGSIYFIVGFVSYVAKLFQTICNTI